jgi:hypothetical protein
MKPRVNKPRVFLSHSALDKPFIEKLANDLRRCQIEPWLDTEEIRAGQPWLQVIFEEGIPTCDAILVYITENSLNSRMVTKEIDAALLRKLGDAGISLLTYVEKGEVRGKLRLDLQTLQCQEWNFENYAERLSTVVAEIWRSYMERMINLATLQERNRSLELELELQTLQAKHDATPFTSSEEKEFQYLHQKLNHAMELMYVGTKKSADEKPAGKGGTHIYQFSLLSAIYLLLSRGYVTFDYYTLQSELEDVMRKVANNEKLDGYIHEYTNPGVELLTYGLVRHVQRETFHGRSEYKYEFTEKTYRFKYWLDYYGHAIQELSVEFVRFIEVIPS